jgi:NAD(P)-dependent dehydrogenase (short-subunit alcohol dehydrogenase family)
VIGGSAGIGLEAARRARAEGADVILTSREPGRLRRAALEVDARSSAAFDPDDRAALKRFFDGLPGPIDHVLVTAGGRRVSEALALEVARNAVGKIRPGGTLLLMNATPVSPPFTAALATALAVVGVRVNLIAPGFVDVAALAADVMAKTTGATYDIDGVEQLVARGV